MPIYNCESYLQQSIQSILNQTHTNWELLICDDGSTDETIRTMMEFQDSRIRIFRNPMNLGIILTSNFLFEKAHGEFIILQDADDWSESTRIASLLQEFESNSASLRIGIVSSGVTIHYKDGVTKTQSYPTHIDKAYIEFFSNPDLPCTCASMCFRRSILDEIGMYDPFFNRIGAADYDFIYRVLMAGYSMVQVPEALYHVRRSDISFTKRFSPHPFRYISPDIARLLFEKRLKLDVDALYTDQPDFDKEIRRHFIIDKGYALFRFSESLYFSQQKGMALWYAMRAFLRSPSMRYVKNFLNILISRY
jgi:glycosyltransferase involved in cell wall biosynthesis